MNRTCDTTDDTLISEFLDTRDEAAFERLVIRYGPMVLRACRDVLGDESDAEDAFQATFLSLFRQAGSIRNRESVDRWLHEVACRVARRARHLKLKRREQERQALTMEAAPAPDREAADREWRPILHEEIRRLPAKLRDVIILCHLEGLTVEAAARKLNCPSGTLKSRLVKGRELLRHRLARRGLAASVVLLLLLQFEGSGRASTPTVPLSLIRSTVDGAIGEPGTVPARVEALLVDDEPAPSAAVAKLGKASVLVLVTLVAVAWSLAAWSAQASGSPPDSLAARVARWVPFGGPSEPEHHCPVP